MRRILVLCGALLLLAPAGARADGDPASDVLLAQDAYFPYTPNATSRPLSRALDGMLKSARSAGFPVKVALIAAPADLGAYPTLFSDPQRYADLLQKEISFNTKPRVLVVLPSGLGGNDLGDRAATALAPITVQGGDGDGLARTAMLALQAVTTAAGKPIRAPAIARARPTAATDAGGGGGGVPGWLVFGGPVVLVALAAALAAARGAGEENDRATVAEAEEPPRVDPSELP